MKKFFTPKYKVIKESDNSVKFEVSPLKRGFGITIGNSLRRILLSSILGYSVYAIKIDNIRHEFQVLSGVTESVVDIIMNLKKLIIKGPNIESDEPIIFKISNKNVGPLLAKEIIIPGGYEILNKDLVIANCEKKNILNMTLFVNYDRGYDSFSTNQNIIPVVGAIAMDSNYSPVSIVTYEVEPIKIGYVEDFEKLVMSVNTNGSIKVKDAISYASKILINYFNEFTKWSENVIEEEILIDEPINYTDSLLEKPIESLNLTVRSYNCLKKVGIENIKELINYGESELLKIDSFGQKSLTEIKEKLNEWKIHFKLG